MYSLNGKIPTKLEAISFSDLNWKESDIEELLRQNVDMLCDDEDSMLIVGQQVQDVNHKRSDLTASRIFFLDENRWSFRRFGMQQAALRLKLQMN